MTTKTTAPKIAKKAAKVISSTSTGKASKSAAGSALSQVNPIKTTSKNAATAASKVLRDGRTSAAAKSAAGSALSQTPAKKSSDTNQMQRTVKPAPKAGSITRAAAKSAVLSVINAKKK